MDTSKKYIKMCDCIEVQSCKSGLDRNDFFRINYDNIPDLTNFVFFVTGHIGDLSVGKEAIWLPRQDQIQEMLVQIPLGVSVDNDWQKVCIGFVRYVTTSAYYFFHVEKGLYGSMEQLWLAYYMHEKHGKVWDGDRWVVATI